MKKKSVNSICSFLRYSKFYSRETRLATLVFDHAPPEISQSTFNICEFVLTKSETVSSICSGEMLDLKILQSEWLRAFWPLFQEQNFSQTDNLYWNTGYNINFHYKTNSGKINDKFFFKFKKPYFWPIFGWLPYFWGQKMFSRKIWHPQLDKVF